MKSVARTVNRRLNEAGVVKFGSSEDLIVPVNLNGKIAMSMNKGEIDSIKDLLRDFANSSPATFGFITKCLSDGNTARQLHKLMLSIMSSGYIRTVDSGAYDKELNDLK